MQLLACPFTVLDSSATLSPSRTVSLTSLVAPARAVCLVSGVCQWHRQPPPPAVLPGRPPCAPAGWQAAGPPASQQQRAAAAHHQVLQRGVDVITAALDSNIVSSRQEQLLQQEAQHLCLARSPACAVSPPPAYVHKHGFEQHCLMCAAGMRARSAAA